MHALRLAPALLLFLLVQLGLYRSLRAIFLPMPLQRRARRMLAAAMLLALCGLPLYLVGVRQGVQLSAALRWLLVEPVLAWLVLALPLVPLLQLGLWLSRRGLRSGDAVPAGLDAPPLESGEQPLEPEAPLALPHAHVHQPPADDLPTAAALPEARRLFLARAAGAMLGGAVLVGGMGVREAEAAPLISREEIFLRDLHPDLDGLTIAQLSDIHSGALVTEERMRGFAQAAAALQADLVVLTGDLLDGSGRAAGPYTRAFEGLHGKLGTYAILGNHDYYAGERFAIRALRDAGQTLLRNSGARIGRGRGSLWLGGVDDPLIKDSGGEVDPVRALAGAAPGEARVLLAHRPGLFEHCADAGAQLVLAGHTHGGQFALSPRYSMARLLGQYTMGRYTRGSAQLYVHRGMGVVGAVPLRLGSPPEIALLTLRRL